MRLAYVGPEGTFSHRAALRVEARERHPLRSISRVFEAVARGEADRGIVPAENVLEGPVNETLDLLVAGPAYVVGEVVLPVEHLLLGRTGRAPRRVYSHPQALAQCRGWLDANLADVERIECASTGEAAALAVGDPEGAAISAALRPGLEVVATELAPAENRTRFFVLGDRPAARTGRDRTSLAFAAPHRPGALHACLEPFARAALNLTRIESRPTRGEAWTYHFLLELEGHPEDAKVATALDELRALAASVKLLGAWAAP